MKNLAIVVRDDAYDRILTPLTFAYTHGRGGRQGRPPVPALGRSGAHAARGRGPQVDAGHAHEADWLKDRLAAEGDPVEIADFLKLMDGTGNVSFYGCRYAASTFEVTADDLIEEADGIVDPGWFLAEKAVEGRPLPVLLIGQPRRLPRSRSRQAAGGRPYARLKARLKATGASNPTRVGDLVGRQPRLAQEQPRGRRSRA